MPRSFRLVPPEPSPVLLPRPRLMRILLGRWESRVTTVVGGAGLGKTTALVQALGENRLAPRGTDLWFGLEPSDADADHLARAVTASLAGPDAGAAGVAPVEAAPAESPTAGAVAEAVWQRSPAEVCLVFDDVHCLPPGSTGAAWLVELIDALPGNGHVVLAGRTEPPVPLSRLGAHGDVLRLDEERLRFTVDELAGFAATRGIDPTELTETGGWPALAELTANVDHRMTGSYMWEEVLEPLGDVRRHILAVLADLGGADDDLVEAAVGRPVDLTSALQGVPLVARSAAGWHVAHALWRQAPGLALDPDERDRVRRRAVTHLVGLGRFDEAYGLVVEAECWDVAPEVLRSACLASDRLVSGQLERWLAASPEEVRSTAPGRLAHGLLLAFTAPLTAVDALREAMACCRAADDVDAEMIAIAQLGRIAWFSQDDAVLGELLGRVGEIEAGTGHPAAQALSTVAQAAVADLLGDDAGLLEHLESIRPSSLDRAWELLVSFWAAQVRLGLGETEPIHRIVDRLQAGDDPALRGAGMAMRLSAWWAEGKVERVVQGLPEMVAAMRLAGVQHNLYLALNGACLATARTGDREQAGRWFEDSLAAAPASTGELTMRSAVARAYLHLADGEEDEAVATLRAAIEAHGLDSGVERDTWRQHIALAYVLLPETREHWDGQVLKGHLLTARTLGRALVALRDGRGEAVLRTLALPEIGRIRSALDVQLAVELAVGLDDAGRGGDSRALLDALGPPGRAALRELAGRPDLRARPAKALLSAVPAAPPHVAYLSVLGPMSFRREGFEGVDAAALAAGAGGEPELRRAKLRLLVGYLVGHRRTTRAALMATLWPDLDERAAANNLGVTLNYLLRMLEPWRHSGEPPYLLRSDGQAVRLVTGDHLRIDVDRFDHHVDAAARAEADGVPSLALEHDLAAADLYRGELFADLPDAEWFSLDREHYRIRFVGAAVRAGQLLLGRGDADAAEVVAGRALAVDRWAEDAYAVLVGAALARRDRAGAQRMLDQCIEALQELGAQPSPATRQLRRRLLGAPV